MMHQTSARQQMHQEHATTNGIDLHGSLLALSGEAFIGVHAPASPAPTSTIIVHGSALEPMNSRAINQLIQLLISARRQQQRLLVLGLSEHQQYIFEITRLCQYIDIAPTETQAVAAASIALRGTGMLIGETAL
jgi:anti-anti-sigma regulatory factor